MSKKIADISHYHPVKDWGKVKDSCSFLISKATQGTNNADSTLTSFISGCERRKIPYWLYCYLNKGNEKKQAEYMVSTCEKKVGNYFVGYILDVEAGNSAKNVKSALNYINSCGYKTMLYTMYADYRDYKDVITNRGGNCAWWEARYGKNDGSYSVKYPCHTGADLHQYTSNGSCDGIGSTVDLNRVVGNTEKGLSWFVKPSGNGITEKAKNTTTEKKSYSGTYPSLPPSGYYQNGDGTSALKSYRTQIKRVQALLNWILDSKLTVDGKYGDKTEKSVKSYQKKYDLTVDGQFGSESLKKAKTIKK